METLALVYSIGVIIAKRGPITGTAIIGSIILVILAPSIRKGFALIGEHWSYFGSGSFGKDQAIVAKRTPKSDELVSRVRLLLNMSAYERAEEEIVQRRRHLAARNKTVFVEYGSFRCLAYLDVDGKWKRYFGDDELPGDVREIKPSESGR